ncbi:hypothetical protein LXA43DRAFT_894929, partial [Ganoderma leucocontextum]
ELTLRDALQDGPQLDAILEMLPGFMTTLKAGYTDDPLFKKVLANMTAYPNFTERDRSLYVHTRLRFECLCVPQVKYNGKRMLTELFLDMGHRTLGHFGPQCTNEYLRRWVWCHG